MFKVTEKRTKKHPVGATYCTRRRWWRARRRRLRILATCTRRRCTGRRSAVDLSWCLHARVSSLHGNKEADRHLRLIRRYTNKVKSADGFWFYRCKMEMRRSDTAATHLFFHDPLICPDSIDYGWCFSFNWQKNSFCNNNEKIQSIRFKLAEVQLSQKAAYLCLGWLSRWLQTRLQTEKK